MMDTKVEKNHSPANYKTTLWFSKLSDILIKNGYELSIQGTWCTTFKRNSKGFLESITVNDACVTYGTLIDPMIVKVSSIADKWKIAMVLSSVEAIDVEKCGIDGPEIEEAELVTEMTL